MSAPLPDDPDPYGLLRSAADRPTILGSTEPRLWTPPLRLLTPETSYGFEAIEYAECIGRPMDPWQQWLAIHAGELLPDGRPRFRRVVVLVSRQNGKTEVLVILTIFWLFKEAQPIIFGSSTNLVYAKEPWGKVQELAEMDPGLWSQVPKKGGIRETNGEQEIMVQHRCTPCEGEGVTLGVSSEGDEVQLRCEPCHGRGWTSRSRYKIGASNRRGGRSLAINRLISDEVREQESYDAYNAGTFAMNAVPTAQAWYISNQGDHKAVVLNDLRDAALEFIEHGTGDPRLGLFEWSAPDGADVEDLDALAQANPNLGRRIDVDALLGEARTAKRAGGKALTGFKTEAMCMRVPVLDPAIDAAHWAAGADERPLDDVRDRLAACVEVSPDGLNAGLVVAAVDPDTSKVRVEVVKAWSGAGCTADLRRELPVLLGRIKPKRLGWFPNGPAAVVAADLADRSKKGKRATWPPRGLVVDEIRTEVPAVCMGFADLVRNDELTHPDDPLLNKNIGATQRLWLAAKLWIFDRPEGVDVSLTYAAAGAAHIARTMPPPPGRPRLVVAD